MVNGADDPRCPIDGVRAAVAAAAALGGAGGEEDGGGWPLALHAEVRRDGACLSRSRIRTLPHKAVRENGHTLNTPRAVEYDVPQKD